MRAIRPATREELEALVNRLIDERVADGELSDSNLTFRELQVVKEVFLQVLQGVHHPRIQYPEGVKMSKPSTRPATASSTAASSMARSDGQPEGEAEGAVNGKGTSALPLPGGMEEPAGV